MVTTTPLSAVTVITITIHAVAAAMHYYMKMMHIISMDMTTAVIATTKKLINVVVYMITAINLSPYFMVILSDISALS